jgi:hypothetical protein
MSTKRRTLRRGGRKGRLTPEVIAAWLAADFHALHCALGLRVWEASPLPREITPLGCDDDGADRQAVELQRRLLAAAGWPDCRHVYEANLREAQGWASSCRELVKYPDRGGQGTNCDPASRREALRRAEAEVRYRKELLTGLDEVRRRFAPGAKMSSP